MYLNSRALMAQAGAPAATGSPQCSALPGHAPACSLSELHPMHCIPAGSCVRPGRRTGGQVGWLASGQPASPSGRPLHLPAGRSGRRSRLW